MYLNFDVKRFEKYSFSMERYKCPKHKLFFEEQEF